MRACNGVLKHIIYPTEGTTYLSECLNCAYGLNETAELLTLSGRLDLKPLKQEKREEKVYLKHDMVHY